MKHLLTLLAVMLFPVMLLANEGAAHSPAAHESTPVAHAAPEKPAGEASTSTEHHAVALEAGPTVSHDTSWAMSLVIIIGFMFIAAIFVGPIVRANAPEQPPEADAHGHDDHGHGHDAHGHDAHGHGAHGH